MTCAECQYQWCWLCEGKYTVEHYQKGKCKGNQFIKANSLEEAENINRENRINQHRDGNYCCSCCCIESCAETNWSCSFIAAYIGIILLFCIAPVGLIFLPLATLIGGATFSVIAGLEIAKYEEMDRKCLRRFFYFIQVIVGLVMGMYVWGILMIITVVVYALIWVIPVTNPFFSSWLMLQELAIFSGRDDYDDYED